MPEALAIVLVCVVSVAAYLGAMVQAKRPIVAREEIARAQAQREWLQQRLAIAQREQWEAAMVADIQRQLAETKDEINLLSRR